MIPWWQGQVGQGFGRGHPAPVGATGVRLVFRFVTGAVAGGSGEVFIDDVALVASDGWRRRRFSRGRSCPAV